MVRRNHYGARRPDGYMSAFEATLGAELEDQGIDFEYESLVLRFTQPAKKRRYTPDFILPNGIIIEAKGKFETADRQKHLWVRDSHPDLDIRFVFSSSKRRIGVRSRTTYGSWCRQKGFKYYDKIIPLSWIKEKPGASLRAIEALRSES